MFKCLVINVLILIDALEIKIIFLFFLTFNIYAQDANEILKKSEEKIKGTIIINKKTIKHKLTSTATTLWTCKFFIWKSITGSISILIRRAKTNGTIIGWVKFNIKATAVMANMNNDPVIIRLLSRAWFIWVLFLD